jgi:hypothetical protein
VRKLAKAIAWVVLGIGLAAGGLIAAMIVLEYPGGMRSNYRAVDGDTRLTRVAAEAKPVIAAIERFANAHGHCPDPQDAQEVAEFVTLLPGDLDAKALNGSVFLGPHGLWSYSRRSDTGICWLWRKLGWDPSLTWTLEGERRFWTFDPGDGSEVRQVVLDP